MKFSGVEKVLFAVFCSGFFAGQVAAQNQWIDSILPPDHLLENLPWMGDDGKIESKGLFDFEDIRGIDQKDLVLIFRPSVPVNELDKPHNQTLVVCFYDPRQQKYVKNFEDEGGTIQWIKFLPRADKKGLNLFLQRDDLKGGQVLKGFSFQGGGMKPVLEAMAPQVFTKFVAGFQGSEVLCSSKDFPKDKADAEHVFSWDEAKSAFTEEKSSSATGWTGASIAKPVPTEVKTEPQTVAQASQSPAPKASHPSKNGWWDDPLDPAAASAKLNSELVPDLIKKGQIAVLGQKAKAFFSELQKRKSSPEAINGFRAGYYAAVASTLLDSGKNKDAAYYLKLALSFQADNADALAVKAKLK